MQDRLRFRGLSSSVGAGGCPPLQKFFYPKTAVSTKGRFLLKISEILLKKINITIDNHEKSL